MDPALACKQQMQDEWEEHIAQLPFKSTILFIRCNTTHSASPGSVQVPNGRLTAKSGEYYFVVVYYEISADWQVFGFIARDSVHWINTEEKAGSLWRIPLVLCQTEEHVASKHGFEHYQYEHYDAPATLDLARLKRAFDIRLKLYAWLLASPALQDAHRLKDEDVAYARVAPHSKVYDSMCYLLLARYVKADIALAWLDGEEALLRHKILLRPKLGNRVCCVVLPPRMNLENALLSLRKFHQMNQARIRLADMSIFRDRHFKELAVDFLDKLRRRSAAEEEDKLAAVNRDLLMRPERGEVSLRSRLCFADIRQCAPACMRRLIDRAVGTSIQQAGMNTVERMHLNRFLLDNRMDAYDIGQVLRPRVTVEYEMESGQRVGDIVDGIATADQHRDQLEAEDLPVVLTCADVMSAGLCAHKPKASKQSGYVPPERWKLQSKQRFVLAKQLCHADMLQKFQSRKSGGRVYKGAVAVKKDWAMSPWSFTQTVAKGERANADKKPAEPAAKKQRLM